MPMEACGVISALTPPARAALQQPDQMLRQAIQTATSPDEHAVSTDALGP